MTPWSVLFDLIFIVYSGVELFLTFQNSPFLPNWILVDFHVLACSSFIFQPISDFLGSADSWDPEDFKNGLKKANEGRIKAVRPFKVSIPNLSPLVIRSLEFSLWMVNGRWMDPDSLWKEDFEAERVNNISYPLIFLHE